MFLRKVIKYAGNLLLIFLSMIMIILTETISASAARPDGVWHNVAIHSSSDWENVCIENRSSAITFSTAKTRIENTLRYDNTSSDWHRLASDRVYFYVYTSSCTEASMPASTRMWVVVKDSPSGIDECNASNSSCTLHLGSPTVHNGYSDYPKEKIYLKTSHINGTTAAYHHVINHEFGHALGLIDGIQPCDPAVVSVMFPSYYCGGSFTDLEWPSTTDRNFVTNYANMNP